MEDFKLALRRHSIPPALEKILSDGVDMPRILKSYFSTNVSRREYRLAFGFHRSNGSVLISGYPGTKTSIPGYGVFIRVPGYPFRAHIRAEYTK
jgi:hypothetical protein